MAAVVGSSATKLRLPDRSYSPVVAPWIRCPGLVIEYGDWTHGDVECVTNLRNRLSNHTHSTHRLLAQVGVLVDRFDQHLLALGNPVPQQADLLLNVIDRRPRFPGHASEHLLEPLSAVRGGARPRRDLGKILDLGTFVSLAGWLTLLLGNQTRHKARLVLRSCV